MSELESFSSAGTGMESPAERARKEFRTTLEEAGDGGETVERLVANVRERARALPQAAGASLKKKADDMENQLTGIDRVEKLTDAAGLYRPADGVTVIGVDELWAEYTETHTPVVPLEQVVDHELYHEHHKHGTPIRTLAGETHGDFVLVLGDVGITETEAYETATVLETGPVPSYAGFVQTISGALDDHGISRSDFIDAVNAHDMTQLNNTGQTIS